MGAMDTYMEAANTDPRHMPIVKAAVAEFRKKMPLLDLARYQTAITDSGQTWIVHYRAKGTPDGYRGSSVKGVPGFTVELDKGAVSILKSYFVR